MANPEMGSRESEEIPQKNQLDQDKSESGAELDLNLDIEGPDPLHQETRMDTKERQIQELYEARIKKLEEYEQQIMHEFGLKPEDFKGELKRGESSDEDLDQLLQAVYKKREEIEQDRKEAIQGIRQQLKEEIDEI